MGKCHFDIQMEKVGLDELSLFELVFCELDYLVSELTPHYSKKDYLNPEYFLLRAVGRILNVSQSIHTIYNSANKDADSLYALLRSLIDKYAIIYLFYNITTNLEEQKIRILLYTLDGLTTRQNYLQNDKPVFNPIYISSEEFQRLEKQCNEAIESDEHNITEIHSRLKDCIHYPQMNQSIIAKRDWRYKKLTNKYSYTWKELYRKFDNENVANIHSEYLSQYTHGLGISDIQYLSNHKQNPIYAIGQSCSILDKCRTLLKSVFCNSISEYEIDFRKTDMAQCFLLGVPRATMQKYYQQVVDAGLS